MSYQLACRRMADTRAPRQAAPLAFTGCSEFIAGWAAAMAARGRHPHFVDTKSYFAVRAIDAPLVFSPDRIDQRHHVIEIAKRRRLLIAGNHADSGEEVKNIVTRQANSAATA